MKYANGRLCSYLVAIGLVAAVACGCDAGEAIPAADAGGDQSMADLSLPTDGPTVDSAPRFTPAVWTAMSSPTTAYLRGVWGSGPSDIWAVGYQGAVVRYDGSSWSSVPQTAFVGCLNGVWGEGPTGDIFAVGGESSILTYSRTPKTWTRVAIAKAGTLHGVWGSSETDLYVVGRATIATNLKHLWAIFHHDGSTWTSKTPGITNYYGGEMFAVWGVGKGDVHVVGSSHSFHHNGSSWTDTKLTGQFLHGVWGCGGEVFAVGRGGAVYRRKSTTWTRMPQTLTTADLQAVWCGSPSSVYAVGRDGVALHHDGTSWTGLGTGTRARLYGVWGTGAGTVYAVGDNGTILRYTEP